MLCVPVNRISILYTIQDSELLVHNSLSRVCATDVNDVIMLLFVERCFFTDLVCLIFASDDNAG